MDHAGMTSWIIYKTRLALALRNLAKGHVLAKQYHNAICRGSTFPVHTYLTRLWTRSFRSTAAFVWVAGFQGRLLVSLSLILAVYLYLGS